jgi:hypothetical protein
VRNTDERGEKPRRRGDRVGRCAICAIGAILVVSCSSKNPDALTGMNVDENLAMMDSNGSAGTNAAAPDRSQSNSLSADATARHASGAETSADRSLRGNSAVPTPPAGVNAVETNAGNSTEENETLRGVEQNETTIPNTTSAMLTGDGPDQN